MEYWRKNVEIYFPLFLQSDVNSHGLNYEIAMNSSSRHIAIVAPSGYASDREAYTRAVKHLIDLGHRRIAFFAGPQNTPWASERFEGYRDKDKGDRMPLDAIFQLASMTKIMVSVGRTGTLTPLALLNPVEVGGVHGAAEGAKLLASRGINIAMINTNFMDASAPQTPETPYSRRSA